MYLMQDTVNSAKSGSEGCYFASAPAAAILIFSFWSLVKNCCPGMWRTCGFSAPNLLQGYRRSLEQQIRSFTFMSWAWNYVARSAQD